MSPEWTERSLVAEHLCGIQPPLIRSRLLEDERFCAQLGLNLESVITVGGIVPIRQGALFGAARRVLLTRRDETLRDALDRSFKVGIGKQGIVLKNLGGREEPWTVDFPELSLLSPHGDERLRALEELLKELGPLVPDLSWATDAASHRELTDEEVERLIRERLTGVLATQGRAERALRERKAGLLELVPDTFAYYEKFCGPDPKDETPESYLRNTLPEYRKSLLLRDLVRGLDNSLMGALRDDLMPGPWLSDVSDDHVWAALEGCEHANNPFALLGTLDVALLRQDDNRFHSLAQKLTERLLSECLLRPDSNDAYDLLTVLAELVANRMNTLEGGTLRPPFWKRMCAWMQAGFLSQAMSLHLINLASFKNWVNGQLTLAGEYATTLDLRREPMYSATVMSAQTLRQEVLGRLLSLRGRHEAAGRTVPMSREIEASIRNQPNDNSSGWWAFPGPLEGHQRPAENEGRALPEAEAVELAGGLSTDPAGPLLSTLAHLSQRFDLTGTLLSLAREAAMGVSLAGRTADRVSVLGHLADACLIAAAHRDVELSGALAAAALTGAQDATEADVHHMVRCLLLAGAAFQEDAAWAEWLELRLVELAIRIPRGAPSETLLTCLGQMKSVTDMTLCLHCRAEALAAAAVG